MKNNELPVLAAILLCAVAHFGCGTDSDLFLEKEENKEMEYEYVEVDEALMAKLDQMRDTDAVGGEPQIEFFDDQEPIKRFWSYEDYYTAADLIWEEFRLTGEPILIHRSLQRYLEYKQLIPPEELALVNYERRLIIGDTLYTLAGSSYTKQHLGDPIAEEIELSDFNPSQEIKDYLTRLLEDQGVSRLTDVLISHKSADSSGTKPVCDKPNEFGFFAGFDTAHPIRHIDMCVWDFDYPNIKANPGDTEFTSNSPGAIVMWNTSYKTWTRARRGIAHTRFFKYREVNQGSSSGLDFVIDNDLPNGQIATVEVTVKTSIRSRTRSGRLSTWASTRRRHNRGTASEHTATLSGVSGLPDDHHVK